MSEMMRNIQLGATWDFSARRARFAINWRNSWVVRVSAAGMMPGLTQRIVPFAEDGHGPSDVGHVGVGVGHVRVAEHLYRVAGEDLGEDTFAHGRDQDARSEEV